MRHGVIDAILGEQLMEIGVTAGPFAFSTVGTIEDIVDVLVESALLIVRLKEKDLL